MKRLLVLLSPSLLSGSLALILALLTAGLTTWSYIEYRQFYYDTLFGVHGLKTAFLQTPDHFAPLRRALFGSGNATYYVVLILCATLVGFTVYTIASAITRMQNAAKDVALEMQHPEQGFRRTVDEAFVRLGVRAGSLVAWAIYTILWFNILMPYCTLTLENAIDGVSTTNRFTGWLLLLFSYCFIALGLHLHVVFMRLCCLRVRVFGTYPVD